MEQRDFTALLRNRALKATSNRIGLLNLMEEYKSAIPFSKIQESVSNMDRVTLYRTIETLKESGVIHRAYQENNEVYYAICGSKCDVAHHEHEHIHFKCNKCKAVTCEPQTNTIMVSIPGCIVEKISINVEGICSSCMDNAVD